MGYDTAGPGTGGGQVTGACAWPDHPGFGLTHLDCAIATRRLERAGGVGQMLLAVKADHARGRAAGETWIRGGAVLECPRCRQDSPRVFSLERAAAWQELHECAGTPPAI